jgi:hypothetical protein
MIRMVQNTRTITTPYAHSRKILHVPVRWHTGAVRSSVHVPEFTVSGHGLAAVEFLYLFLMLHLRHQDCEIFP